jgi:hypothetical protein
MVGLSRGWVSRYQASVACEHEVRAWEVNLRDNHLCDQ